MSNRVANIKCWQGYGAAEVSYTTCGSIKWYDNFGKLVLSNTVNAVPRSATYRFYQRETKM